MGLNLSDIPGLTEIYIDANILLFSAFKHPRYGNVCRDFPIRMEGNACTSAIASINRWISGMNTVDVERIQIQNFIQIIMTMNHFNKSSSQFV